MIGFSNSESQKIYDKRARDQSYSQIPFIETESFKSWIKKLPFRALF